MRSSGGRLLRKACLNESTCVSLENFVRSPYKGLERRRAGLTFFFFLNLFASGPRYDTCASRTNIVVEQSFSQESILTPVERSDCVWGKENSTVYIYIHVYLIYIQWNRPSQKHTCYFSINIFSKKNLRPVLKTSRCELCS